MPLQPRATGISSFFMGQSAAIFYDGNKRTARLMAIGTLLTAGLPPLTILAKDQTIYNQILTELYPKKSSYPANLSA